MQLQAYQELTTEQTERMLQAAAGNSQVRNASCPGGGMGRTHPVILQVSNRRPLPGQESEVLYQNAMDRFEGDVELNVQLGLAPMDLKDWFEPFSDSFVPAFVH